VVFVCGRVFVRVSHFHSRDWRKVESGIEGERVRGSKSEQMGEMGGLVASAHIRAGGGRKKCACVCERERRWSVV